MAYGNSNPLKTLAKDFRKDQIQILDDWMDANTASIGMTNGSISAEIIREQNLAILDDLIALTESGDIEDVSGPAFMSILDGLAQVARVRSDAQMPISTFGHSLASLKQVLLKHKHRNGNGDVEALFPLIDYLVFGTIEHFLNAREDFIKDVLDTALDGIVTIDEKGTVQTFNKVSEEMFGYGGDEVIGKNIKMLMPPPYSDEHDSYLANYMRTGQGKILGSRREVQGRRKDGTVFPVELGVREIGKGAGRMYSGVVRDLTEIKHAQEEMDRMAATLNAIGTSQGMIEFETDGTIINANENFLRVMGYDLSEIQGQHHSILVEAAYQESPEYRQFWDDLRAGNFQAGEFMRISKSGAEIWIQAAYNPILDADGKPIKIVKNAVDITEKKVAALKLKAQTARQAQDIVELSTPVISVWQDVLVLPLIGTLDSRRTQECMEMTLIRLSEANARVLIIDITGVPTVDTMVANHLIRLAASVRLMGGRCVLTGISPATAMTIVGLGLDLAMLNTRSTLAEGLKLAIDIASQSNE